MSDLGFKRGSEYTRGDIANIICPDDPPKSGDWITGSPVRDGNVFVFLNMGIPGNTGHDFDNHYDPDTQRLIWFGRPDSHSSQPKFAKILNGEYTLYFFARWVKEAPFIFLGTGRTVSYQDAVTSEQGHVGIKMEAVINDVKDIIYTSKHAKLFLPDNEVYESPSSFVFEKHLEDFIVGNWHHLSLGNQYDIVQGGQQYPTATGPIDILGLKKDNSEFLVLELKRDRASDVVVGQTLRYMGWVKEQLCDAKQEVKGCIIAASRDAKLDYALKEAPNIRFMKYEVDFRLS